MGKHPEVYEITREEWELLNRALCGARLGLQYDVRKRERMERVGEALDVISATYKRAAEKMA